MSKIVGFDEVGLGAWAGPITVGGVVAEEGYLNGPEWDEVTDSKKLSPKKREELAYRLMEDPDIVWFTAAANPTEIDGGFSEAVSRAFRVCRWSLDRVMAGMEVSYYVDGSNGRGVGEAIVKGDAKVKEIAAASIIAKHVRDRWMVNSMHLVWPVYGFDQHKGYGTALHRERLLEYGPCSAHRRSIKWIQKQWPTV